MLWYFVGYGVGDDYCVVVCGVFELYYVGKCFFGDCFVGNFCYGVGVDYDFVVVNCFLLLFVVRRS